jgi:cytochrome b subunit of formate dehydrogenase
VELLRHLVLLGFSLIAFIPLTGAQEELTSEDCLVCHSDEDLSKEGPQGEVISLFVDGERFAETIHGDFACTDCHTGITELPHEEELSVVDCSECHDDVVEEYAASVHGEAHESGNGEAAYCTSCHGDIHVLTPFDDPMSPIHPIRLAQTCARCHSDPDLVEKYGFRVAHPAEAYENSIHAVAAADGRGGATCSGCHGSHGILPADDPASTVNRWRVTDTCGACHGEISDAFRESIHGIAVARGVGDAPVCTGCHGEHHILTPREAGSPVSTTNQALQTCGHCHGDVRLTEKYGLPTGRVSSYRGSYHGLAARAGSQTVASCASCHGVHDILPSSDPRSHVYKENLATTCGQCHPGAGERFAIGPVHVVDTDVGFPVIYYIRIIYVPLIIVTITGMLLHVVLDFVKKWRQPELRALAAAPSGTERMNRGFRVAHGLVMVSFPVLVYTGFTLTYPEAWWARPIVSLGPEVRGWLHRVAGVVLLGSLAYHIIHLVRSRQARACMLNMRPSIGDWRELRARFRYYVGLRKTPVHSPEVGYIEKAEYLAFWWGMIIMALTGFLLWFNNFTLQWLPPWVPAAATTVHFYEAVLATLAILVWHFYWTIFDPAVYPMDMSWWHGKAPASRDLERRSPSGSKPPSESHEGQRWRDTSS